MNKEIRDKWCAALRGEAYKQGVGHLRSAANEFCCLGVLCDILPNPNWTLDERGGEYYRTNEFAIHIPGALRESIGLSWDDQKVLIEKNDDGATFKEIANYIETNL